MQLRAELSLKTGLCIWQPRRQTRIAAQAHQDAGERHQALQKSQPDRSLCSPLSWRLLLRLNPLT